MTWAAGTEKKPSPQVVTAAVIERDGRVLIGKRKRGKRFAGNWEFPGGTSRKERHQRNASARVSWEEVEVGELFCSATADYAPTVRLLAYRAMVISGTFSLNDHEEMMGETGGAGRLHFPRGRQTRGGETGQSWRKAR